MCRPAGKASEAIMRRRVGQARLFFAQRLSSDGVVLIMTREISQRLPMPIKVFVKKVKPSSVLT